MGLKSDFEESAHAWRAASPLMKIWLTLSIFLASGSIASLSETLIKWKGFFLAALEAYRGNIIAPLHAVLASFLSINIPRTLIDISVLTLLVALPSLRIATHPGLSSETRLKAFTIFGGIMLGMGFIIFKEGVGVNYAGAVIMLVCYMLWATYKYYRGGGVALMLWLIYLLLPISLIGLLGALNVAFAS